jgi:hypothetical protein
MIERRVWIEGKGIGRPGEDKGRKKKGRGKGVTEKV